MEDLGEEHDCAEKNESIIVHGRDFVDIVSDVQWRCFMEMKSEYLLWKPVDIGDS